MKALIIEDHDVYREMLESTLSRAAFDTVAVRNAHDLPAATAQGPPQLAIVDWLLGSEKTGSDAARELRDLCPGIRTILITGYPIDLVQQRAAGSGIDAILAKPFSSKDLLDAVARVLAADGSPEAPM